MDKVGIGFIGSGFNARFHMQGLRFVRDADVLGVWSPNAKNATSIPTTTNPYDGLRNFVAGSHCRGDEKADDESRQHHSDRQLVGQR